MIQNEQLLAVFSSAHRVMKAESILKQHGFPIRLIPAPRALSTDCGLAIRFDSDQYDQVFQALNSADHSPTCIYRKCSDSDYQPIWSEESISG